MKKILAVLFALILSLTVPNVVFAAGGVSVSTGNLSITEGESASFTITANNAAGRVDIASSNPGVAAVSVGSQFLDRNSCTVTVTAGAVGSAAITVQLTDVYTFDEEDLSGRSYTVQVTVNPRSAPPTPGNNGNSGGQTTRPNTPSNSSGQTTRPNTPSNSSGQTTRPNSGEQKSEESQQEHAESLNLSRLEAVGYSLDFDPEKTEYELAVGNEVNALEIFAEAESEEATVIVTGSDTLEVGENTITVQVTGKDGAVKEYHILVIRSDEIPETTAERLEQTLKNTTKDTVALRITDTPIVSKEQFELVKNSGKRLLINRYDGDVLRYTWSVSDFETLMDLNSEITIAEKADASLEKLTNYARAAVLEFSHSGDLPKGTKVRLNVQSRYADGEVLNMYYYNGETLQLAQKELTVQAGYVEFELTHCSEYVLTQATLGAASASTNGMLIGIIVVSVLAGLELIALVILGVKIGIKKKTI